jgi:hypothetical protein
MKTATILKSVIGGTEKIEVNYNSELPSSEVEFLDLGEFMDEDEVNYYYGNDSIRKDETICMFSSADNHTYGVVVTLDVAKKFTAFAKV